MVCKIILTWYKYGVHSIFTTSRFTVDFLLKNDLLGCVFGEITAIADEFKLCKLTCWFEDRKKSMPSCNFGKKKDMDVKMAF